MHITGGQARGLRIQTPPGDRTRPTTDRVRESLFSILRDLVPGAAVVDLFAGSGALGLEAASRGAASVTWVEQHPKTCAFIRENASRLPPAGVQIPTQVLCADVFRWLARAQPEPVDLVLADPPYELFREPEALPNFLTTLRASRLLSPEGLLALELSGRIRPEIPSGWSQLRRQDYGTTSILLLELQDSIVQDSIPRDLIGY